MSSVEDAQRDDMNWLYPQDVLNQKDKRLRSRDDIKEVMTNGEKVSHRFLVARYKQNTSDENRFAVIISKKVEKLAVKRNRLRRQIYETIRSLEKEGVMPNRKSFDIVLFARKALPEKSFEEIKTSIKQTLITIYGGEEK